MGYTRSDDQVMIKCGDIYHGWTNLLEVLLKHGAECRPRGQATRELIGLQLRLDNPLANIIRDPIRKLNMRFMVAEWLCTVYGLQDKDILTRYLKSYGDFTEDGAGHNYPSYGPILAPQWAYIRESLTRDFYSRQAVSTIWAAHGPGEANSNVPCTLSIQWLLRQPSNFARCLYTIVTMRSSDAWFGIPYDVFNFSMLSNYLASQLASQLHANIFLGPLILNLGSSHLYEQHWGLASEIIQNPQGTCGASDYLPMHYSPDGLSKIVRDPELVPVVADRPYLYPWNVYENVVRSQTNTEASDALLEISERVARKNRSVS